MRTRHHLATLLALAAALVPFAAIPAHAQKPALTENIDEKGRVPYHSNFQSSCSGGLCAFNFKSVPEGFRLVITHASAQYEVTDTLVENYVLLDGGTPTPGDSGNDYDEFLPPPVSVGQLTPGEPNPVYVYMVSSPVTYYVEPGGTPKLVIVGVGSGGNGSTNGSISGYLVAIP
jgi:hypothetical protein